jgi:hypothetical protein
MKLKPLKQWICDTCGQVIEKPADGYVIFDRNNKFQYQKFQIVHHLPESPLKDNPNGCYDPNLKLSMPLETFLGDAGKAYLLTMLDVGKYIQEEYRQQVSSIREWVELFRRVQLPYYEEARLYWDRAYADGFFVGANEYWPYMPENLKLLIKHYSD